MTIRGRAFWGNPPLSRAIGSVGLDLANKIDGRDHSSTRFLNIFYQTKMNESKLPKWVIECRRALQGKGPDPKFFRRGNPDGLQPSKLEKNKK